MPSRDAALHRLRYALERNAGPALAYGPAGSGKTILARTLGRDLGGPSVVLTYPAMPAAELMAWLADELGAPPHAAPGLAGSVHRIGRALADRVARGEETLLIVDDAHLIADPGGFEALGLLLNFASGGSPDLRLLFVGGLETLARMPPGLADRLGAKCRVDRLTRTESSAYVLGRLALAGATEALFDGPALDALYRESDGLPRRINRLADLALLIAYARESTRPDAEAVAMAAREAGFELAA